MREEYDFSNRKRIRMPQNSRYAHRHLHKVAAVAAVGVAPIGARATGPQSLVGFLE